MSQSKMSVTGNTRKKFVMMHAFKDVMNMKNCDIVDGPIEYHYGIPWKFRIYKDIDREFDVFLDCPVTSESADWSINLKLTKTLLGSSGEKHPFSNSKNFGPRQKSNHLFTIFPKSYSAFIVNGNITIDISAQILKMAGTLKMKKQKLMSFDESISEFSDVILKVGNQKFYMIKKFLALHSTYFKSLFSGNFAESQKSEIELKDIEPEQFQNFLELINGESFVEDSTVEGILNLADFFDSKTAIRRCEEFLLNRSKLPLKVKFDAAIKCQLDELKKKCISEMKTKEDVKSVIPKDPTHLHPSVWAELFEKVTSFN